MVHLVSVLAIVAIKEKGGEKNLNPSTKSIIEQVDE